MGKRLKLRISRVVTSLSLQSCRSKDPSTLPSDPIPVPSSIFQLRRLSSSPTGHLIPFYSLRPPKPVPRTRSSFKRNVSSAACTGFRRSNRNDKYSAATEFKWRKEDKWHVVAKACNNDDDVPRQKIYYNSSSASGHSADELFPPKKLRQHTKTKKKTTAAGGGGGGLRLLRISTSSTETTGLFSSEAEEEESETLVPSTCRSFSTYSDSSASIATPMRRQMMKRTKKKNRRQGDHEKSGGGGGGESSPARLSVFVKRMIVPAGCVEGKVKESYAVVKKSEDPKQDFKRSMMEMVLEKEMFEEVELEQLLQCFLSLNSTNHQGVIVQAFTETLEALFPSSSTRRGSSFH